MATRVHGPASDLMGRVSFQERYYREGMSDTGLTASELVDVERALLMFGIEPMTDLDREHLSVLAPV